jgi:hypothetical protein
VAGFSTPNPFYYFWGVTMVVACFIIFTKRATANGVFHYFYEMRHWQWRICFLYIQNVQRLSISLAQDFDETRHCQWCVS